MTSHPHPEPIRELSARTDIEALHRALPIVKDIKDFTVPGVFQTDNELEDFLRWSAAER